MQLYDLKKLSLKKSIPVPTLRKLLKKGMPHYRPGRKIYINPDEFDAWFKNSFKATGNVITNDLSKLMEDAVNSVI